MTIKFFISYAHHDNNKMEALSRAIKKAKTPYITFMDPVSINYQKRLDYQIRFMENNPGVAAIGSQAKYIDHKNKIIQKSSFPLDTSDIVKNLILGTTFEPSTLMINKTLLPKDIFKLQSSKPEFVYINLMLQISRYGKLLNLEKPLVYIKKVSKTNKLYSDFERFLEHIKLFIKSMETAGEKPTLKAFFSPLLPEI